MHKEMSLSLLTLPTLHTPQAALHHPSVIWETAFIFCCFYANKRKTIPRSGSVSTPLLSPLCSPFLLFFTLTHLHLNSPCHQDAAIALSGVYSLPLSARPSAHPFPASINPSNSELSVPFNRGCPTRGGHGWSCGHRASAGLEKLNIEFIFQILRVWMKVFFMNTIKYNVLPQYLINLYRALTGLSFYHIPCTIHIHALCSPLLSAISPSLLCKN